MYFKIELPNLFLPCFIVVFRLKIFKILVSKINSHMANYFRNENFKISKAQKKGIKYK